MHLSLKHISSPYGAIQNPLKLREKKKPRKLRGRREGGREGTSGGEKRENKPLILLGVILDS